MRVTKHTVTVNTTHSSSTGGSFYSTSTPDGFIYAVGCVAGTIPSTAVLTISADTTSWAYIAKTVGSADWLVFPRAPTVSSSAVQLGYTTDPGGYPGVMYPIRDERIKVYLTGGTSAATTGLVEVYVSGNSL